MRKLKCEHCGELVEKRGVLYLPMQEFVRYEKEYTEHKERHKNDEYLSLRDLPSQVRWVWGHEDCVPDYGQYWITQSRFNTTAKALAWTLHLMQKNWIGHTNWEETVRRLHTVVDA